MPPAMESYAKPRVSVPLTERKYFAPLALITSLFFLWAFGVTLNDVLVPHFKKAFSLTDFQSSFIQFAFFGGYCLAAFPAGRLMERIGYKKGILIGLSLCATGALLFVPVSYVGVYMLFLVALFVMACGQSFLEVASNPYVTILGPAESSERRLNFCQSFNSVGAVCAALLGRGHILTSAQLTPAQSAAMTAAQLQSYRQTELSTVRLPYVMMAGLFLVIGALIFRAHLPDVVDRTGDSPSNSSEAELMGVLSHRHLVKGVIAQFFYVGAQVGVSSFVIRFAQHVLPGTSEKLAGWYLLGHLSGFMLGRFGGSALMKWIAPARLLSACAAASMVCALIALLGSGLVPVLAVVLLGLFHSIMFPTIFALSIRNLGPYTKIGSSLLVMSIMGGAVIPAIMGRISDLSNMQTAFVVPLICYIYVLYFATLGYKPAAGVAPAAQT
ncbi:MAG: L-fucose:H+ symporter permease [Candidatus Acidiferrales bacterium]